MSGTLRAGFRRAAVARILIAGVFAGALAGAPATVFGQDALPARTATTTTVLTLAEAFQRARHRSEEIQALEERIVEAEINVSRAWSLLKPTWNASFSFTHTEPRPPPLEVPALPNFSSDAIQTACREPLNLATCGPEVLRAIRDTGTSAPLRFDFARENTSLLNTTVTWNIFNGRSIPLIANAYDTVTLEKERASATTQDLLLSVARAYYAAAATAKAIEAARRAATRSSEELSIAVQKSELGESVKSQRVAAEIAARQSKLDVRRAGNAHQQAISALALLTRSPESIEVELPEPPARPTGDPQALKSEAFAHRGDVRAAELAVILAERTEDEAWWKFAPTVSLFGGFRWSNVAGISGQNDQWTVGVIASALLYDGGLRYQDLRSAESKIRAASRGVEALRARVSGEIDRGFLQLEAAEMVIERVNDTLLLAEQRRALTTSQYAVGALRGVELAEANDAVLDAELSIIRAEMDRAVAILELQRALGIFAP